MWSAPKHIKFLVLCVFHNRHPKCDCPICSWFLWPLTLCPVACSDPFYLKASNVSWGPILNTCPSLSFLHTSLHPTCLWPLCGKYPVPPSDLLILPQYWPMRPVNLLSLLQFNSKFRTIKGSSISTVDMMLPELITHRRVIQIYMDLAPA